MCKLIVLDNNINSPIEFKQIIGRGTRLLEDYGKTYFTIMDFRNATRLFADKNFDGNPEVVIDITGDDPISPATGDGDNFQNKGDDMDNSSGVGNIGNADNVWGTDDGFEKPKKYYIKDVEVKVLSERVQYIDKDGKLITESLIDYTKKNILGQYARLDVFLKTWNEAKKKQAIVDELREDGVLLDAVREETGQTDIDDFDLILHLAYDKAPLTRIERIKNVQKRGYLYKYSELARKVLGALMDKYASEGLKEIEETKVLQLQEFQKFGSPMKIVKAFGGKAAYEQAVKELEDEIFSA